MELEAVGGRYLVFQEEMGASGNHHLQGYIEMPSPCRHTKFRDILPGAHWEVARGTGQQCKDYCTKADTRISGPYEVGTMATQGQRSDILSLRDAVKSGKRGRELYDDDSVAGAAIRYGRGVDKMVDAYTDPVRRESTSVTFHFGPAGTGKSHCCASSDAYLFDGNAGDFWLLYKGQTKV